MAPPETASGMRARRSMDDPAAFVAAAETITNERNLAAIRPLYAIDAVLESIVDGAVSRSEGRDEITRTWELFFAFLAARDFRLTKRLLIATDAVIVNDWTGSLGGHTRAVGVEVWRFDPSGLICEHSLYGFLNVRPATSALQRLRMVVAYPLTAFAFLRAELSGPHTSERRSCSRRSSESLYSCSNGAP